LHYAAIDEAIVVAILDLMKAVPCRQRNPLVATAGELQGLLVEGGLIPAGSTPAQRVNARALSAALSRVADELRRRGVHVAQSRRVPGVKPASGSSRDGSFSIWCDEDALLDVVWRSRSVRTAAPAAPEPVTIEPMGIDPGRPKHLRAAIIAD
jgi:hypothetical protein